MKLTKTLNVTPEEFFDALEKSIVYDIHEATGKDVPRAKLNGYKYEKKSKLAKGKAKGTELKVKIREYTYPSVYDVKFTYPTGVNNVRYEVQPRGENSCEVCYTEEFEQPGGKRPLGWMGGLQMMMYNRQLKQRANATLQSVVKAVEDARRMANNPLMADDAETDASESN